MNATEQTTGIIIISADEYKQVLKTQKTFMGQLINKWDFKDSTRHFDIDYIKVHAKINKGDIKKVLTMTYEHPLYINVQNKLVKYRYGMCCQSTDAGAYRWSVNPGILMNDHPTSDVVIVVKNGSKFLQDREARCPRYWAQTEHHSGSN